MNNEWKDHLTALPPSRGLRTRHVFGCLLSAVRYRLNDLSQAVWRPVDWVLTTHQRTDVTIALCVGSLAVYVVWRDGAHVLLTEGWAWLGGCGAFLAAIAFGLRRMRGIEPVPRGTKTAGPNS